MSDKKFELSRRKALIGLGSVGVASAGAGIGTSAYFTDEEEFDGNSLTAGTLNLSLKGVVTDSNRGDPSSNGDIASAHVVEADGDDGDNDTTLITFEDVKPGDKYLVRTDLIIEGNPAYVQLDAVEHSDVENGYEEPEPNPGSDGSGGELDDEIQHEISYAGSDNDSNLAPADLSLSSYEASGSRYQASVLDAGSLQDSFDATPAVADLDGDTNADPLAPGTYRSYHLFELPGKVGNEVQGDSVTFALKANVEQSRNNSDPFNSSS
jgi:predicted ribosomally synthesized peptide with SipW-like signal peptide